MKTLLILFFASLAYAQQPDVVQIPNSYDLTLPAFTIPRHPVVRCTLGKVNVFIRWNNLPTATFAANGQLLSQEAPTLTPAWIKSRLLCLFLSALDTKLDQRLFGNKAGRTSLDQAFAGSVPGV